MTALSSSRQRSGAGSGLTSSSSPPPSLERVLREDRLLEYYIRFLKKTQSFENVFFWLDVESFRALERREDVLQQASSIYNKYIVDGSQLEVNIDSELKQSIAHEINGVRSQETINTSLFNEAQEQVLLLMKESSYRRFLQSEDGKQMLKDIS